MGEREERREKGKKIGREGWRKEERATVARKRREGKKEGRKKRERQWKLNINCFVASFTNTLAL